MLIEEDLRVDGRCHGAAVLGTTLITTVCSLNSSSVQELEAAQVIREV